MYVKPAECSERRPGATVRRLWLRGALLLAVMAFIFFMSARSGEESSRLSDGFLSTAFGQWLVKCLPAVLNIRKYAHIFEFLCMGISAGLFFGTLWERAKLRYFLAWGFSLLYAASDEFHQLFVPGRAGRFADVCIDAIGFTAGVLLCAGTARLTRRRRNRETQKQNR